MFQNIVAVVVVVVVDVVVVPTLFIIFLSKTFCLCDDQDAGVADDVDVVDAVAVVFASLITFHLTNFY